MKKFISLLLCTTLLISLFCINVNAAEAEELTVPRVYVTTDDGNGNTIEKADGYVGANIKIEDVDGSVLEDKASFKVRGNSTALAEKKPFTFKFSKKKDVLGMGKGKKWALLANCFDPTLMRNYIAFDIAHELGIDYTSNQKYVELWVDGVFKGCYTLMEPVQQGKDRVDIDIESNNGMKDFLIEYEYNREEEGVTYIAGHPMTGKEKSGVDAADPDLFRGKAYVIVPTGAPKEAVDKLMSILQYTEANFTTLDLATHDRCAAVISHVPHVTAAALVTLLARTGGDREACTRLIGGGFKDTTRIASSNADMWADICMTNGPAIAENLRALQGILGEIIEACETHDRQFIHDYFTASKRIRDGLLENAAKEKIDPN